MVRREALFPGNDLEDHLRERPAAGLAQSGLQACRVSNCGDYGLHSRCREQLVGRKGEGVLALREGA